MRKSRNIHWSTLAVLAMAGCGSVFSTHANPATSPAATGLAGASGPNSMLVTQERSGPAILLTSPAEQAAAAALQDASPPETNADAHFMGQIYRLPYWVETVASICPWRSGDDDGVIRLIRTREEWGKGFYLQWMSNRIEQHKGRPMLASIRVYEIGPHMPLDFALPDWELFPDQCLLTTEARLPDGQRFSMKVAVLGMGQYQLALVPIAKPVPEMRLPAPGEIKAVSPDSLHPDGCAGDPCPGVSEDSQSRTVRGPRAGTAQHYK